MTRLIIVRHGQTEWNRIERFRGQADIPLNDAGLRQAQAAARRIASAWTVRAVYCSDLARARVTAQAIAASCRAPLTSHPGLLDIDYGDWAGLTPDDVAARDGELLALWRAQPHKVQIPGGECLDAVRARAVACMESLAAHHDGQTVVLVSHLVVCRLLVLAALGLDSSHFWRIQQETATVNILEWNSGVYTIVAINDACHVQGA
jgi:phosphoserine phosphatase